MLDPGWRGREEATVSAGCGPGEGGVKGKASTRFRYLVPGIPYVACGPGREEDQSSPPSNDTSEEPAPQEISMPSIPGRT